MSYEKNRLVDLGLYHLPQWALWQSASKPDFIQIFVGNQPDLIARFGWMVIAWQRFWPSARGGAGERGQ